MGESPCVGIIENFKKDKIYAHPTIVLASLVAQLVKNLPAMQKTWVRSLGWEDPLERERLPTPVFWPGEFHGVYSPWDPKESDTTERLSLSLLYSTGNYIQCHVINRNGKEDEKECIYMWPSG